MRILNYLEITKSIDLRFDIISSRKRNNISYFKNINCFDIEVTNFKDGELRFGIPYIWVFAVTDDVVFYGRDLEEFKTFLHLYKNIIEKYNAIQVIYVHNLGYEFQFLRKYFEWDDVFLVDNRKPLYCKFECFEFRCSYLLSNMNLDNFLKNNNCTILKDTYDYDKERFPWTELSDSEIQYCVKDAAGLHECINKVFKSDNRTVINIPYTSTGYVREDIKKSQSKFIKQYIKSLSNMNIDVYLALKGAFVGGNTHANRYYADKVIEDVYCYDIASSYPFCQLTSRYPVEPFKEIYDLDNFMLDDDNAYLLLCDYYDIDMRDIFDGMPQISISKCINCKEYELDNGRILSAKFVEIWVTDIEYRLIKNHYKWVKVEFKKVYFSRYGYLPDCIKACIYTYFENKTKLKGVDDYMYRKSKEKLNSIYGMSAFDVGKRRYRYEDNEYVKDDSELSVILEDISEKTVFAEPYMWGVWTTARAREHLDDMISRVGKNFIYCDTDSVYCKGEVDLDDINNDIIEMSKEYGVYHNGRMYYMGKWECDKFCRRFKTLGAKKYCYEDDNGTHTVTAGVSKRAGVKSVDDYNIGYVFKDATNNAWYCDEDVVIEIDGYELFIPSSIYIESSDYTLGVTDLYLSMLYVLSDGNAIVYMNE